MSIATLILGESGTGKTCSLRNLDPGDVLLVQPLRKPLPFRGKGWREGKGGTTFVCEDAATIAQIMKKCPRPIIVIDDWQYLLANQFMARRKETGFQKFTDIGGAGFDIMKAATELDETKRVYVLAHTATDDMGNIRIKTLGKLLDDKVVIEGMFTTVLRTYVENGKYYFSTQNSGQDTVKSPVGLFESNLIDNDLKFVDDRICEYYEIPNHLKKENNE